MTVSRRGLITGLGALFVAAPAIVRASSLMPVKAIKGDIFTSTHSFWVFTPDRIYALNVVDGGYGYLTPPSIKMVKDLVGVTTRAWMPSIEHSVEATKFHLHLGATEWKSLKDDFDAGNSDL